MRMPDHNVNMATSVNDRCEEIDLSEFLQVQYKKCCICDGFYGMSHGQPVCSTCHMFLFPPDINQPEENPNGCNEKSDSGDSGNEEPNEEGDFYMKRDGSRVSSSRVTDRVHVMSGPKVDRVIERVNALSCPRDYNVENIPSGLVDSLPPEVLLGVFRYLDDISLWTASNTCLRWRQILDASTSEDKWEQFITKRWPLFDPQYKIRCWKTIYTKLLESAPCLYCLESMMLQSTPPIEENSWRHRRLRSELKTLRSDPPEGIQATPLDRHCCHWQASITGPQGSPYEGGLFFIYLQIPHSYPMKPPVVRFITKIFHPNISRHGDVGLDSIHHNWSLALTISKVLISIQSLLTDPFCHVCMEPHIGLLYLQNRKQFDQIAQLWTWKHAMHDYIMPTDIPLNIG